MKARIKPEEAKALLHALAGSSPNRAYSNGLTLAEQARARSSYKRALRRLRAIADGTADD